MISSLLNIDLVTAPAVARRSSDLQLNRICGLLGIDGAALIGAGETVPKATGGQAKLPPGLIAMATESGHFGASALVIADTSVGDANQTRFQALARFLAIVPVPAVEGRKKHSLLLWDRRPRSLVMAYRLLALATEVTCQATIARSNEVQQHNRALFERASQTARIGVWSCSLPNFELNWTNGVYDLFELPRASAIDRERTAAMYTEESRLRMEVLRSTAIAELGEFCMDAEIITAKGNQRWMRLTAAVEAENGVARRIFGMKQDITEEKLLADRTRYLAEYDVMTGLANRSQFQARINDLDGRQSGAPVGGLLVIDLDGFKQVNDTHGHAIGDDYLKEASRRLRDCFGKAGLVARIGGDEFAVLMGVDRPAIEIEMLAHAAVVALGHPVVLGGKTIDMSASIGVAHYVAGSGEELFRQADLALYAAKAAGRGTSRVSR